MPLKFLRILWLNEQNVDKKTNTTGCCGRQVLGHFENTVTTTTVHVEKLHMKIIQGACFKKK